MDVYETFVFWSAADLAWEYVIECNGRPIAIGGDFVSEAAARDACFHKLCQCSDWDAWSTVVQEAA